MRTTTGCLLCVRHALLCRAVAMLVIVAFTMLITESLPAALHAEANRHQDERVRGPGQGEALAASLRDARDLLRSADRSARQGRAIAEERRALADLRRQMAALDRVF